MGAPPSPPPPPPPRRPAGSNVGEWGPKIVVILRTDVQDEEDALERALVVLVGGTRPEVSPMMVTAYLFERFGITALEADIR